ncbi:MAG: AMP-binding protein [Rhizobiales bacterium]|nr:AMP-binding protein [Hyphomicrobiales bacterium]
MHLTGHINRVQAISSARIPSSERTLNHLWEKRLGLSPRQPFLAFESGTYETFEETDARIRQLAGMLIAASVRKGDRVVIFAPNSLTPIHAWMAINFIGAVDVPINPSLRGLPLEHAINLTQAKLIFAEDSCLPALHECEARLDTTDVLFFAGPSAVQPPPTFARLRVRPLTALSASADIGIEAAAPGDLASIMLTSGTSGPSKGVMISHAQAFIAAQQVVDGLRLGADDIHYCCQPLFHMSPRYFAVYAGLLAGTRVWIDRAFQAHHWIDRIRTSKATVTIGHGPLLEMIFDQRRRDDDNDNRLTRIAAAPFPKHIADDFERRFEVKGIEAWGMTEIGMPCWTPYDEPRRVGSCGYVRADFYDFAVLDPDTDEQLPPGSVGEFAVRPRQPWIISPGYFNDASATQRSWRNLWFHTGDAGYIDADGWVYFVDRLKDRIRRRAENISSYDIEVAAARFPRVKECAAVGVPSSYSMDDDIKLFVVPDAGHDPDPLSLLRHIGRLVPHYMVPRFIAFVDQLPRTPTQKIRRAALRQEQDPERTWDRKSLGQSLRQLLEEPTTIDQA